MKTTINEVKQLGALLRKVYLLIFLALILLIVVTFLFSTKQITHQTSWYTYLNSFCLIYALGIIPFALKRFFKKMRHLSKEAVSLGQKMVLYKQAFMERIWWVSSVSLLYAILLLFTNETSEFFMSLIGIIALCFCSTSEISICRDLDLLEKKEEEE